MKELLEFLTDLFSQGLGYSAVNTARSAISTIMQTRTGQSLGSHPTVVRFMKGIYELKTPQPRYKQTWDVSILLDYFKSQETNARLSLPDLSMKVCALMLLTSAQRVQTIHLMKRDCVHFTDTCCVINLTEKMKQSRPGFHQNELKFNRFTDDSKLCVVEVLEEYLKRTDSLRKNTDKLLLCYQKPFGPASKDTVSRWMKNVLIKAGIQNFAPHSFRGAAASAMLKCGVPLDDILKTAGWSRASTFYRFYNKPVAANTKKATSVSGVSSVGGQSNLLNYFTLYKQTQRKKKS